MGNKPLVIRHGDMCFREIEKLPDGLIKSKSEILMTGSGGNHHTYENGEFYPKPVDRFIFGYFRSEMGSKLFHKGHGQKNADSKTFLTEIKDGKKVLVLRVPANKTFELRKQHESINDEMTPVID